MCRWVTRGSGLSGRRHIQGDDFPGQSLRRFDSLGISHPLTDQDDEEVILVSDYELVAVENRLVADAGYRLGLRFESLFRFRRVGVEGTPTAEVNLQRDTLTGSSQGFCLLPQVLARRCGTQPLRFALLDCRAQHGCGILCGEQRARIGLALWIRI